VPEKTLEHWASQYVTYRYRSKARLWWPTAGEDVDVRWLPKAPGKVVQLELKTTVFGSGGHHHVENDLGQLWDYTQRPAGHRPFYVFPVPNWQGELAEVAASHGVAVSESAFRRSGVWWFGDRLQILSTDTVAAMLATRLAEHGSARRGVKARLVNFDVRRSFSAPTEEWATKRRARPSGLIGWSAFWDRLNQCGAPDWSQLIRVPAPLVSRGRMYMHGEVRQLLRQSIDYVRDLGDDVDYVSLEPSDGELFAVVDDEENRGSNRIGRAPDDGESEYRQLVFVSAEALNEL
jgi:hypothetical protein